MNECRVSPWTTIDRTLYVDLKAYMASVRYNRNVLATRVAAKSKTNIASHESFVLPKEKPSYRELTIPAGNTMTIVSANRPFHITVTRSTGTLDFGEQTLFVATSEILGLRLENKSAEHDVELNVITV